MIIEYSNAKEPKNHTSLSVAIVVASCAFFFIPTTLIILGYLASQPTGTLISPLPQGILSQSVSPVGAIHESPAVSTTTPLVQDPPLIAAPSDASASSPKEVISDPGSNITDKVATISAGLSEVLVTDPDIKAESQIYFSPRPQDSTVYSLKSKGDGHMTIGVNTTSDLVRYVDYHIVNP